MVRDIIPNMLQKESCPYAEPNLSVWTDKRINWWKGVIEITDQEIWRRFSDEFSSETELTESALVRMRSAIATKCRFFLGTPYPQYFTEWDEEFGYGNCVSYGNISSKLCETIGGKGCVIPFNLEAMHILLLVKTADNKLMYFDTRGDSYEDYLFQIEPRMLDGGDKTLQRLLQAFYSPVTSPIKFEFNLENLPTKTPFVKERHTGKMYGINDRSMFFLAEYLCKDADTLLNLGGERNIAKAGALIQYMLANSVQSEPYHNILGKYYMVKQDYPNAINIFSDYLKTFPDHEYSKTNLNLAQSELNTSVQ